MPGRVRIALFNTGVGLKKYDPDPHWQVVAASNNPQFKPRPALMTAIGAGYEPFFLPNDAARSQWIASAKEVAVFLNRLPVVDPSLSDPRKYVVYTFRTTFDLGGMLPHTAFLRGRLLAGNHVTAIRLNGRNLDMPKCHWNAALDQWAEFRADRGFVEGTNVLEIDVFNNNSKDSGVVCRVELEGFASRAGAAETTDHEMREMRRWSDSQKRSNL